MQITGERLLLALDLATFIGHLTPAMEIDRRMPVSIPRRFDIRKIHYVVKRCDTHLQVLYCELFWVNQPSYLQIIEPIRRFCRANYGIISHVELDATAVIDDSSRCENVMKVLKAIASGAITEAELTSDTCPMISNSYFLPSDLRPQVTAG